MISLRVFIATLALVVKLDNVRARIDTWTSPVLFYYKPNTTYYFDTISIDIILKNVPAEAKHYVLYYQTDTCDRNTTAQHSAECDVPARTKAIPTNRTINFMQKLDRRSLRIYIDLRNKNKICATKRIMDGLTDINAHENQFSNDCLNEYVDLCGIIADFGNQCEELRANVFCSQHQGPLMCEVVFEEIPEDTVHQWYQEYRDGSLIGTIPTVKGKKIEFKMTIHEFDSNTYISSVMRSTHWEKSVPCEQYKVPLPENGYKNYDVKYTKKYTANQEVSFNCTNNAHPRGDWTEPTYYTQIGMIESTGNKITTYDRITRSWTLTKEHNGTTLCCLNYHTYTVGIKTVVERTVTDITVLIYEEPINHEQPPAKINCTQKERLTCEVVDEELPEDTVHQWYQVYKDGSLIGTIPTVEGKKTEFKMTLHKFDNNTYIFKDMNSPRSHWGKKIRTEDLKVPLPKNRYIKNYDVEYTKKYTANQEVGFNCSNSGSGIKPIFTQIGVIESTGNKISTYNKTNPSWTLTKGLSGTMFCCLNYHTYTVGKKMVVERNVTKITVWIYEEPVNQGRTTVLPLDTSTNNTPAATSNTHQPGRAPAESTPPRASAGQQTESDSDSSSNNNYYIAIAAVVGLILLASLTYVVIKKYYRKSSDPEQTLQLETYATSNMVLYAELDMRPGTGPAPATTEEATYAEIIGVLRPNEHVNKL